MFMFQNRIIQFLKFLTIPILFNFFLLACGSSSDDPKPEPGETDSGLEEPQANTVRFIAVGDTGTGDGNQYRVANAMRNKCELDGCKFVLMLGDNIYENGVDSMNDAQFESKFENPFQDIDAPFYVVTGNHDYGGYGLGIIIEPDKALYQVDYSDISPNSKWRMPEQYYQFSEQNISNCDPIDMQPISSFVLF